MADEVEIVKNSVDVLGEVFAMTSTFATVSTIINVSAKLASAFPVVGAILALVAGLLPDVKHQEILKRFDELSHQINQVRSDIKELGDMLKLESADVNYARDFALIEIGIEYCIELGKRSGKEESVWYREKLKDHCANGNCATAMRHIFNGMLGTGALGGSTILDRFYASTKGDRPKISAVASRLLKVIHGGMMVLSTYETMRLGKKGAADVNRHFYWRLNDTCNKVKSVLDKCVQNFYENMHNDLAKKLDQGGSNRNLANQLSVLLRDKYDWLENFCLVYNDLHGFKKHCLGGQMVAILHRNGKCGLVYYREKSQPPRIPDRYAEALQINRETSCRHAQKGYNDIAAKLGNRGIGWTGLAVVKSKSDLQYSWTFTTRAATDAGPRATAIILLQ